VTADARAGALIMPGPELPGPLAMARDWASTVSYIAAREPSSPGAGKAQFEAAQMASYMALVSIAESLHEITRVLLKADTELEVDPAGEGP
jgi:hypothetical protein